MTDDQEHEPVTEADPWWLPDDDEPANKPVNKPAKAAGSARAKSPGNGADADPRPAHGRKAGASGFKCVVCGGTAVDKSGACQRCGLEWGARSEPGPNNQGDDQRPAPVAADDDQGPALNIRSSWGAPPPAREWLVDGWLPAHRIAMIAGRGAAGKSQIALQLSHAITTDLPDGGPRTWFAGGPEIPGGQGVVCFVTWEDDSNEILRRMLGNPALRRGAPEFDKSVGGRFHFIDLAGQGPLWAIGASHRSFGELTPVGASLRATCQSLGVTLVIVDALSSAFAANENDRASVRAFLSSWDRWARDCKCAVLLVAHPPKSSEGVDSHFSGSTDWRAGVRSLITLSRPKGVADRATLTCDKLNSARTPNAIPLGSPRWWETIVVDPNVIEIDDAEATEIRQRVMQALATHGELSKNKIRAAIQKSKAATFNVVDRMELGGEIIMHKQGSAHLYALASENTKGQDNV